MDDQEKRIAKLLIKRALTRGYTMRVWDGEDWATPETADHAAVMAALGTTDADSLVFYKDEERVGTVFLVWGNGADLIGDHTDNAAMTDLTNFN